MTRAVIDPNVLVSAFISQQGGAPDRIVREWREGAFELVVSPQMIAELTDVLGRPKFSRQAAEGRAQAYIAAFAGDAVLLDDPPDPAPVSPDSDDDYLIALARVAGADVIVSGDPHLTQLIDPSPPVLTPRQFADQLTLSAAAPAQAATTSRLPNIEPEYHDRTRSRYAAARAQARLQILGHSRRTR